VLDILPPRRLVDGLLRRIEHGVTTVVAARAEEGVAEHHIINIVQGGVVHHIPVDEEEDGEIDFLSGADLLLLKAEALDLGKVWRDLVSAVQQQLVKIRNRHARCT